MDIYAELGVTPIINAAGTLTALGGSLMPREVLEAMESAAGAFVDLNELHLAAGERIAQLVGVEAAHVSACGAAGIAVAAAACMAGTDPAKATQLPHTRGMRHKFVVQHSQRNSFDQALRQSGGEIVAVEADVGEVRRALASPEVAAAYCTLAWSCMGPALPVAEIADLAHAEGVPCVVDAAAEVPPLGNLRRFLDEGADLVIFSGGKAIRGPQSSGLILGRRDLIEACRANNCPNSSIGRPMKTSKEDIAGLVKAVELYVRRDHAADMALWEQRVAHVIEALSGLPRLRAWRQMPYGVGQLLPHAAIAWEESALGLTYREAVQHLRDGRPRVAVQFYDPASFAWSVFKERHLRVMPHMLEEGEERVVARRLREVLAGV